MDNDIYNRLSERMIPSEDSIKIGFLTQCIEDAAEADNSDYLTMFERLEKANLTEGYILRFYDTLHTQSSDYVTQSILTALLNHESATD